MYVRIDETGNDGQMQGVDVFGILGQTHIGEKAHRVDPAISYDDATRCEFFGGT